MDDIARLLEDRLDEIDRARVLTHICACRHCHRLFQDSAIELGLVESGGLRVEGWREDLVGAGSRAIGSERVHGRIEDHAGTPGRHPRRRSIASRTSRALALVTAAAVIGWGAWFSVRTVNRSPSLDPGILSTIEDAVRAFSATNEFVLPGGEDFVAGNLPAYRAIRGSQFSMPDEPLQSAIDALHKRYHDGGESPDVAYWLVAGYLSKHRLGAARVYITDARRLFPEDPQLMVLDAIIAYADGALDRSETLLRSARAANSDSPVILLDLAIVLGERRETAEARELLTAVLERRPNTPIGARAKALLEKLP